MINVPSWAYKRYANGEISTQELEDLEKLAQSISSTGRAGAAAVVSDPSNNLPKVLNAVSKEDRDDVLRALRQLEKRAMMQERMQEQQAQQPVEQVRQPVEQAQQQQKNNNASNKSNEAQPATKNRLKKKKNANNGHQAVRYREQEALPPGNGTRARGNENPPPDSPKGPPKGPPKGSSSDSTATKGIFNGMTERNKMLLGGAGLLGIGALGYGVYKSRKNSSTQQPMQEKKAVNGAPRVSSTKERLARRGNLTKKADIGTALAIMGGATAAPILGHLAMRGIDSLSRKSAAQIQQDLQRILQVHPDIGKINDPRVQMAYQTLLKLNPAYAEDPLIAGPLLKQIVENRLNPMNPSSGSYIDPGVALKLTEGAQRIDNMRHPSLGVDMNKSLMSNTPDAFRAAFASNKTK